ncbi:hypothetical protein WR25_24928 [Diploscapter pachys]|uniref:Uncharacterized protein n=1 Tax=Diploscapter pachys TaxID=2018661 RepID=A0A2A2KA62_9BILA|nr:hypothetical protein WR25_24928 [Diploscapter pachys]
MNRWLRRADQVRDYQQGDTQHLEQPMVGEDQQRQARGGGGGGADPPSLALAEVGGGCPRKLYRAARIRAKPTATTRLPPVVDRTRCQPSSGAQASALCS